jgi:hypothetical protein
LERRGQDSNNPRNPWKNRSFQTRRRKIRRAPRNRQRAPAHEQRTQDASVQVQQPDDQGLASPALDPLYFLLSELHSLAANRLAEFSCAKVHNVVARSRANKHGLHRNVSRAHLRFLRKPSDNALLSSFVSKRGNVVA